MKEGPPHDQPGHRVRDLEKGAVPSTTTEPHAEVLRPREAARYLGISRSTLDRWRKSGEFPKALQLGAQSIGWRKSTLDEWLDSRPAV